MREFADCGFTNDCSQQATNTSLISRSAKIKDVLRSFASFAECFCFSTLPLPSKLEKQVSAPASADEVPDFSTHWYCVRQQPGNEFFTVRRVPRLPDEEALQVSLRKSEASWLDLSPMQELIKSGPIQRSKSVPRIIERRWCMQESETFEDLKEDMQCRICYSEAADVVLLPCRHGGMCYRCFRRSLFMRPIHRGGCTCPTCRRQISEVVRIGKDQLRKPSAKARYGIGAPPLECF